MPISLFFLADGPDRSEKRVVIGGTDVRKRLSDVLQTEDLGRFVL